MAQVYHRARTENQGERSTLIPRSDCAAESVVGEDETL